MGAGDRTVEYVEAVVQMPDGTFETRSVPQYSDAAPSGLIGERSYRCVVCGAAFKEHDIQIFRGKPYGVPCGCYKDIRSILLEERAHRYRDRIKSHKTG
jgi:hypothetical protein